MKSDDAFWHFSSSSRFGRSTWSEERVEGEVGSLGTDMNPIFPNAYWIWTADETKNQYVAFVKTVPLTHSGEPVSIKITASSYYELYINGDFVARGPVYGDPQWCLYDELSYTPAADADHLHVTIVAHHSVGSNILAMRPARAGILASFSAEGLSIGTDETWACVPLPMWKQDVPPRGWALDYCEDYDARLEPEGWPEKVFPESIIAGAERASLVLDPETHWAGYQARPTPYLQYRFVPPISFSAFRAPGLGAAGVGDVSADCDRETLIPVEENIPYEPEAVQGLMADANAFTFDLGAEYIGFYKFEITAPEGVVLDVSGAELLEEGRPRILRKGTRFSMRYHTRAGRQRFRSFAWSGFRYLHLVIRGDAAEVTIHQIGCQERRVHLQLAASFQTSDTELQAIFDLCRRTLEVGTQEHLIDCPTREQAQYWGDALFIAESLWIGFGEPRYLEWYLDCFLHAPFNDQGQISGVYPGGHWVFLDYSLIPILGQRFYHQYTGAFYKRDETCAKALALKAWYDGRANEDGLVQTIPSELTGAEGYVNFIDHPGLGWHDFPHRGIDREGISCALNLFYYGFLHRLADMLEDAGDAQSSAIRAQAEALGKVLIAQFFDGTVFHDARLSDTLSEGTSWQTNSLAVYFNLVTGDVAAKVMRTMLDRYDTVCRCSPYFHFYFLPALRKVGMEDEALALIKHEWQAMIDRDATTTWEGFGGDDKDSYCHPWSTAPFLYLLTP